MKQIIFIICCLFVSVTAMGQQPYQGKRPMWLDGYHSDHSNSYLDVVSGKGATEQDARKNALETISRNRSIATGQRVSIRETNGNVSIIEDELTVKARIVDEYVEHIGSGEYRVSLLVQTARNPELQFEPVKITSRYPITARILVPGMAQLHKGSTVKGISFITGEALAIGGIVAFESLRASYKAKISSTHNAALRKDYINRTSNMGNIRNCFIAGAAIIYVWNIIDGAVTKGDEHIEVGKAAARISPYATASSAGISLCLNF